MEVFGELKESEKASKGVLNLPIGSCYDAKIIEKIIKGLIVV
ncbi:hypothetical protein [Hippea jasoniae]|nr:hypothetical protein [Hippea jasoniae]